MKIVNVTQYEAKNGKRFDTEKSCFEYDKFLELSDNIEMIRDEVNDFLSNPDNYADWVKYNSKVNHYCNSVRIEDDFDIVLEILYSKNSHYQLDEDFCIDQNKWYKFLDKYKKESYTRVSAPTYYWGK